MNKGKTDNSFLQDKVDLRVKFIPQKNDILVLDLFSGEGVIWNTIAKKTGKNISVTRIDKKKNTGIFHLNGDNRKYLPSIDLSVYDIIDVDAYGIPYDQIKHIIDVGYKGHVFVTYIKAHQGRLPYKMLMFLGYTKAMIKKCPTLFSRDHFDKFKKVLHKLGISYIDYIEHNNKYYIHFKKESNHANDLSAARKGA